MQIAEEAVAPAQSQKYQNFIIRYNQNVHGDFDYRSDENFQIVNDLFGILYVAEQNWDLTVIRILRYRNVTHTWIPGL